MKKGSIFEESLRSFEYCLILINSKFVFCMDQGHATAVDIKMNLKIDLREIFS